MSAKVCLKLLEKIGPLLFSVEYCTPTSSVCVVLPFVLKKASTVPLKFLLFATSTTVLRSVVCTLYSVSSLTHKFQHCGNARILYSYCIQLNICLACGCLCVCANACLVLRIRQDHLICRTRLTGKTWAGALGTFDRIGPLPILNLGLCAK